MAISLDGSNQQTIIGESPDGTLITAQVPYDYNQPYYTYDGGGDYSTGGTVASAPAVDQNLLAQYDQAINNTQAGIDLLPGQLQSGLGAIDTQTTNALNTLLLGRNQGEQNYNTSTQQARTGYVGAKNTIGSQAGSTLNGLQRLLGSRGAGGGSAYNIAAPQAVARGASLQRSDVGQQFGQNMSNLAQGWGQYLQSYENERSGVNNQATLGKQRLSNEIDVNRADLLRSLATLQAQRAEAAGGNGVTAAQPYLDQANALLKSASNYTVAPINYQTQAYQAPAPATYTTTPGATPQYEGSGPGDYFSPYLAALLGKRQEPGLV